MTIRMENDALDRKAIELDRSKKQFRLYRDLEATSTKTWLVKNLLGHAEVSAFYGAPGSGKSALIEDMGLHVAAGQPWHGRDVRQGAVCFVALERRRLVERRAIAFRIHHAIPDLPFAIIGGLYDFRDNRTAETVAGIVRQVRDEIGQQVVLIIVDTISRALAGGDENSSKDMGAIVATTARLQEATGSHVAWVHHVPIDAGERLRGHGALLGALDTTINVEKLSSGLRTATVIKANDSEEGERIAFTLDSVTIGPETTAPVVVPFDGEPPQKAPSRKLAPRYKLALENLTDLIADKGKPAPTAFGLPGNVRAVSVTDWRDELFARGVLDNDAANPREDFRRIKEKLQARHHIAERDALVWLGS